MCCSRALSKSLRLFQTVPLPRDPCVATILTDFERTHTAHGDAVGSFVRDLLPLFEQALEPLLLFQVRRILLHCLASSCVDGG